MYRACITITPREGVLEPEGKIILSTIHQLGHDVVKSSQLYRVVELTIDSKTHDAAHQIVTTLCEQFLVNSIMEDYTVVIEPDQLLAVNSQ